LGWVVLWGFGGGLGFGYKNKFGSIKTFTLLYVTMICLNCNIDFNPKRPTAKFCSDNCRVKYHRKHGKKEAIKPFQMQALYNEIKEMVGRISVQDLNKPTNQIQPFQQPQTNYVASAVKQRKSPQEWVIEKREIEDPEIYRKWVKELEEDPYLSTKEKSLIKQA